MRTTVYLAAVFALGFGTLNAHAKGNAESGKAKSTQVCAACHGVNGNKPTGPDFPILAGQHADFLKKSLHDYKSGKRNNPIMKGFAATLSNQDMDDLAAWYASQPSHLVHHR